MEVRKSPRFPLVKPVVLRIHQASGWRDARGTLQNASLTGAFLLTDCAVDVGLDVELTILLAPDLRLFSSGKIIRVAKTPPQSKNGVAIECGAPWVQISGPQVN